MKFLTRNEIKIDWVIVFLLTCFAFGLRWPGINNSLYADESTSFLMFGKSSWQSLVFNYQDTNQHSLFSILSNFFLKIFGESELVFRLPAFLAGILSVSLIYFFTYQCAHYRLSAFLSSFILTISGPQIMWSQLGRGYALTILLAMLFMLSVFKLIENSKSRKWGLTLIISGFSMVLTLPSNVHFVFGCSLFFIFKVIKENRKKSETQLYNLIVPLIPLIILFGLVITYFLLIYRDLQFGLVSYLRYALAYGGPETIELSWNRLGLILKKLIIPWDAWFYLVAIFGWWFLKRTVGICFLVIFIVPLLDSWFMGTLGPPRSFIFWLPFVIVMAGCGFAGLIHRIGEFFQLQTRYALNILFSLFLAISPFYHLKDYYFQKTQKNEIKQNSLMWEGKEAFSYIENKTFDYGLVVFPFHDRVLRRYIEESVSKRMMNIFREGKLDKIIFMGNRDVPPQKISDVGIKNTSLLPQKKFKKINEIGNLFIYSFDHQISRMYPHENDLDHENKILWLKNDDIGIYRGDNHKFVGEHSIVVRKNTPETVKIYSDQIKTIKLGHDGGYILLLFAKSSGLQSNAGFAFDRQVSKPIMLNFMFGNYHEMKEGNSWYRVSPDYRFLAKTEKYYSWQIIFFMVPLDKEAYLFKEMILSKDKESYFDGFQIYALSNKID